MVRRNNEYTFTCTILFVRNTSVLSYFFYNAAGVTYIWCSYVFRVRVCARDLDWDVPPNLTLNGQQLDDVRNNAVRNPCEMQDNSCKSISNDPCSYVFFANLKSYRLISFPCRWTDDVAHLHAGCDASRNQRPHRAADGSTWDYAHLKQYVSFKSQTRHQGPSGSRRCT